MGARSAYAAWCLLGGAAGTPPRFVAFVNELRAWHSPEEIATSIGVPGYAPETDYTVFVLGFWRSAGPLDAAKLWANPTQYFGGLNPWGATDEEVQRAWASRFAAAGKQVLVSLFGGGDKPTSAGLDARETCGRAARFAKSSHLHGVDINWEDTDAMDARGMAWLADCTRAIRAEMGGGLLSHSPQAPCFSAHLYRASYHEVEAQVGHLVDWYNVQFYNQVAFGYDSYETLFACDLVDGKHSCNSVGDIVARGLPADKLVVGKVASLRNVGEGNSGYMGAEPLAAAIARASAEMPWRIAGVSIWQYIDDPLGRFIAPVAAACDRWHHPHGRLQDRVAAHLLAGAAAVILACCVVHHVRKWAALRALHRELTDAGKHISLQQRDRSSLRRLSLPVSVPGRRSGESEGGQVELTLLQGGPGEGTARHVGGATGGLRGPADPARGEAREEPELLWRRFAFVHPVKSHCGPAKGAADAAQVAGAGADGEALRGYEHQSGCVRYSRLLLSDRQRFMEDPEADLLSMYSSKMRGFIKLAVVITLYSETPDLLERSLRGVAAGLHALATASDFLRSWDEAVVCIVCDGIEKMDKATAQWMTEQGIFDASMITKAAAFSREAAGAEPPVAVHCFEGLLRLGQVSSPLQTVVLAKAANAGKLDSQMWAFCGLCERLMPLLPAGSAEQGDLRGMLQARDRYIVTVDAGTEPLPGSIERLVRPMRCDLSVAGTCGHMVPDAPGCSSRNVVVMSQVFEYEMGHVLDKAMESMFGFITVLPGAFSAYRFDAIRRDQWQEAGGYARVGPLVGYFKSLEVAETSPAMLNRGLAEDRILAFELVTMKRCTYYLRYEPHAYAVVDVPDTLDALMKQRRRWNNGAFFAKLHALYNFRQLLVGPSHSFLSRGIFLFQAGIMVLDTLLSWFAIALMYSLIAENLRHPGQAGWQFAGDVLLLSFMSAVITQLLAYGFLKRSHLPEVLRPLSCAYGLQFVCAAGAAALARDVPPAQVAMIAAPAVVVFGCSLLHGRLLRVLPVAAAYAVMLPTYAVLSQVHAFCQLHDVSWGTKGIEAAHPGLAGAAEESEATVRDRLSFFRFKVVLGLLLSNAAAILVISCEGAQGRLVQAESVAVVVVFAVRGLGSVLFVATACMDGVVRLSALPAICHRGFGEDYDRARSKLGQMNQREAEKLERNTALLEQKTSRDVRTDVVSA